LLAAGCVASGLGVGAEAAIASHRAIQQSRQPRITESARIAADSWWAANGQGVLSQFRNGQCTDWAARKRPDFVKRVFTYAYALSVVLGHRVNVNNWYAGTWTAHARWAHVPTGNRPEPGALMVFQRGSYAGEVVPESHIGYVEAVNRNGSFRISQMNAPHPWQVTHHTFPGYVSGMSGISFIYH
jgi:surface antigen